MTIIGAQSLSISREPDRWFVVFGYREEKVAIFVVFYLCYGSLVAMQHQRLLQGEENNL